MALTYSEALREGMAAPAFDLAVSNPSDPGSQSVTLASFDTAPALVVLFTCNHCPYAKHIEEALVKVANELTAEGAAFLAINSNDVVAYPQDGFEHMADRARERSFSFPYALDEDQSAARAFGATCTPDIFVFDQKRLLRYHGRFDETRPGMGVATGSDLRAAVRAVLQGTPIPDPQVPSVGCSIKWKA